MVLRQVVCLAVCLCAGRAWADDFEVFDLGEPAQENRTDTNRTDTNRTNAETSLPDPGTELPGEEAWAVSGDIKLRPIVLANGTKRERKLPPKPHADTVLQYKQIETSTKERGEKAALARRVTVKDKVREIGKPRPKTGVVAPVLQAIGYETVIADFISYGCELPVPGKLPPVIELGESEAEGSTGVLEQLEQQQQQRLEQRPEIAPKIGGVIVPKFRCDAALAGEDPVCELHGEHSSICKQLKASNEQRCGSESLLQESKEPDLASCDASCRTCVGTGPKKCTKCAELKAFVTQTVGEMGGECRAWPSKAPLKRGSRSQGGMLTPPLSGVTTEINQGGTGKIVTETFGVTQRAQPSTDWAAAPANVTEFIPQCSWWKQVVCIPNADYSFKVCKEKAGCKDGKKPSWLTETPKECIVSRCNIQKLARLDRICFRSDKQFTNLCEGFWGQQDEGFKRCECYAVDEIPKKYMSASPSWCKQFMNNL